MVKLRLFVCAVLALFTTLGLAQPSPTDLSQRLAKAAERVSYVAVRRVTFRGPEGKPRVFDERVMRSRGRVYLSYFDDSPYADQKIWELKGKRYIYTISKNELRVTDSHGLDETIRFLKTKPSIVNGENVAGRPTYRVSGRFEGGRGSQTLWIDTRYSVVLKREIEDGRGDVISAFEVSEITFNAKIPDAKFVLPKNAKFISVYDDLKRFAKEAGVDPFRLTARGYKLQHVGQFEYRGTAILRQFYIKDSTKVSLFVLKGSRDQFESRGRVKIYRWKVGDQTLVLVGEMDEKELQKLARSVKT